MFLVVLSKILRFLLLACRFLIPMYNKDKYEKFGTVLTIVAALAYAGTEIMPKSCGDTCQQAQTQATEGQDTANFDLLYTPEVIDATEQ